MGPLFVDTSAWSDLLRKDQPTNPVIKDQLIDALDRRVGVVTTGLVLQELHQGFAGPRSTAAIDERFASVPLIEPSEADHRHGAEVFRTCRRSGVQLHTVDALLAALCIRRDLPLLTSDRDFDHAAQIVPLQLWHRRPSAPQG